MGCSQTLGLVLASMAVLAGAEAPLGRSDEGCTSQGGQCLAWTEYFCTAGWESGICDGDSNRKCCLPCNQACLDQENEWSQEAPDPEFRALFIATAFNVDWPTNGGESASEQQDQMLAYLNVADEMNMNAVMFQIRPAADALYDSPIEPWSKFLTGTQGYPPNPYYDPLTFVVEEAHNRGIEVHVWLNPYRGGIQSTYDGLASNHVCNTLRDYCYIYDKYLWLDPGAPEIADHLINVISDVVTRYDIDGVHFDDYFYPYPDGGEFPDEATYAQFGNGLGRDDWRRDNVNQMVERCYNTIHGIKNSVKFSISPFGIYRPQQSGGMPPPIVGLDPYSEQYADTKLWLQSGWVDFLAPQLYWKIDPPAQSYPILLDWWLDEANTMDRYVYAANGAYRLENGWPVSEIMNQVALSRDNGRRNKGSLGNIHYSAKFFRDNYDGIKDEFIKINPNPVSVPPMPWLGEGKTLPEALDVTMEGNEVVVNFRDGSLRNWAIHRDLEGQWILLRTLPASQASFQLPAQGRYMIQGKNGANQMGHPTFVTLLYVATVDNIDWPLSDTESTEAQQTQMIELLDAMADMNMNVRPVGDALYASDLEPWSKYLTGTQGVGPEPFYDPLDFLVSQAQLRDIDVHAWLNPYRGGAGIKFDDLAESHICFQYPEYCYYYDRYIWMDPGAPEIADQLIAVVEDLVTRYPIKGIHFDDYFYPYPTDEAFPDEITYALYGNGMDLADWRRDNVNQMVQRCYNTIHKLRNEVVFSISPISTYRPGQPGGMPPPLSGFDPYEEQYADTKLWLQQGWVDFMSPQIYSKIGEENRSFPMLLDWWLSEDANPMGRHVYTAQGAYRVFTDDWAVSEIVEQVAITRNDSRRDLGSLGNIQFSAKYFRDNYLGIKDEFQALNPTPVPVPPMPWLDETRHP
eukprot:maker-scaffold755_size101758-snap-gene-0.22 protein:Tk12403 transcript:maker-scaffold755_size101758-snap-gene-0.22-mRNA-1 annotation:"hypothetical protein CAPTEDRAFT_109895"